MQLDWRYRKENQNSYNISFSICRKFCVEMTTLLWPKLQMSNMSECVRGFRIEVFKVWMKNSKHGFIDNNFLSVMEKIKKLLVCDAINVVFCSNFAVSVLQAMWVSRICLDRLLGKIIQLCDHFSHEKLWIVCRYFIMHLDWKPYTGQYRKYSNF